ncbi:extracellular solute-binding protein [Paenibacillus hodogayensis]|uniref:Extracellular solute-binding protein n=1 Tax=Paenibacillus hodogayensis TaxID=279208 RepID=A0ABV5VW27_9BACL
MRKRTVFTGFLSLTLATGLAGCGTSPSKESGQAEKTPPAKETPVQNLNTTGFPIVKEPISLKIFAGKAATTAANWNDLTLWKEYAKQSNIQVNFELVPFDGLAEKRNLVLTSNDLPDAFHTAQFPSTDLLKYGEQGVFIKLNDLIDKYAPNLKKLMEKNPEIKRAITMTDGNIYSFPTAVDPEFTTARTNNKMWLNKEWLAKLNLPEPKTTDELYNYLKLVKTTDLNGNGKLDEIPFGTGGGITPLVQYLRGSWGLGNRGAAHNLVDVDPKTNNIRFIPTDPKYKELLQYINKLYTEGLIDKDIFTIKSNEFLARGSQGLYGAMIATNPQTLINKNEYIGGVAYTGPYGDHLFSLTRPAVSYPGSFVITNKNKNPEATVRWIDHFYGEEGVKLFLMGFKDVTYKELPDGSFDFVDEIKNNPKGLTVEQALIQYLSWPGGRYPALVIQKYFKGAESLPTATAATEKVKADILKEVWPIFNYTLDENTRIQILDKDINTYVTEWEAKFIFGDIPFTDWDKFVDNFKKLGLDEYLKLYNSAYQRYLKS